MLITNEQVVPSVADAIEAQLAEVDEQLKAIQLRAEQQDALVQQVKAAVCKRQPCRVTQRQCLSACPSSCDLAAAPAVNTELSVEPDGPLWLLAPSAHMYAWAIKVTNASADRLLRDIRAEVASPSHTSSSCSDDQVSSRSVQLSVDPSGSQSLFRPSNVLRPGTSAHVVLLLPKRLAAVSRQCPALPITFVWSSSLDHPAAQVSTQSAHMLSIDSAWLALPQAEQSSSTVCQLTSIQALDKPTANWLTSALLCLHAAQLGTSSRLDFIGDVLINVNQTQLLDSMPAFAWRVLSTDGLLPPAWAICYSECPSLPGVWLLLRVEPDSRTLRALHIHAWCPGDRQTVEAELRRLFSVCIQQPSNATQHRDDESSRACAQAIQLIDAVLLRHEESSADDDSVSVDGSTARQLALAVAAACVKH